MLITERICYETKRWGVTLEQARHESAVKSGSHRQSQIIVFAPILLRQHPDQIISACTTYRHTHTHTLSPEPWQNTKVNTAPIKWAQRADFLYVTIDLHGVTKEVVSFTERELHFQGESEGKYFEANIEFYQPILPKECSYQTHPLGVEMIVKKDKEHRSDGKEGFWPQLLKDKRLEKNEVTVDWKHYVDEDDDGNGDSEHPFLWSQ